MILRSGKFDKISGDIFEFNKSFTFVFLYLYNQENPRNLILCTNTKEMELVLDFKSLHEKNSKIVEEKLKNTPRIDVDHDLLTNLMSAQSIIKKTSKMKQNSKFETIDFDRLRTVKRRLTSIRYTFSGNRIVIWNKDALEDFLRVLNGEFYSDIMVSNDTYHASDAKRVS